MCSNTLYISMKDAIISLSWWLSASTMTKWDHFDSKSDPEPEPHNLRQETSSVDNCLMLPYAHGQHISNVLKHNVVNFYNTCRKKFEVAVTSLNHNAMKSFWLHKWPGRTKKPEPSIVGITFWGYCHMPMDIISMCSNTLYMSNVDLGSSLRWLSSPTMTLSHHFDST
jgi:hypothetical protein